MYENFTKFISDKTKICIIQAENPDGDSLGSALALEALLKDKQISQFCPVNIPKYLRYYKDWSKITSEIDYQADGYIIVDTAAQILLSKLTDDLTIKNLLYTKPIFVIDHHETPDDLDFPHQSIIEHLPSCTNVIYNIATQTGLTIDKTAAEYIFQGLLSDTLGLTSAGVSGDTSAQTLARLPALLREYKPTLVIVSIGGNDFLRRQPSSATRANIAAILRTVKESGSRAVLIGVPKLTLGAALGIFSDHELYEELAKEYRVPLLSDAWGDVMKQSRLMSDQIHPNAAGYAEFTASLEKFLRKQGFLR